jgi:CheY-like chemotaxis protein
VKFTESGKVELRVKAEEWAGKRFRLRVEVEDTGVGINREEMERIFESFAQLDSGLGRRYAGMGLGLTLARGLARAMGGELMVESEVGRGSCFSFTVPLEAAEWKAAESGNRRVLVVDDNEAARKVAEAFLKRGGYGVTVAAGGEEALRLAAAEKFDLVLMDLQMPGMDGITVTERLREMSGYERTPVVALTANAGDEYRILCLSQGMQGYLPKPVESEMLLRTVRQLL